MLSETKL